MGVEGEDTDEEILASVKQRGHILVNRREQNNSREGPGKRQTGKQQTQRVVMQ